MLEPPERCPVRRYPVTDDLTFLRQRVREYLTALGFGERRCSDFVLAVSEALGNVLEHARTPGTLTLSHDAGHVTAEISDSAGLLTDPDAGVSRPPPDAHRGYGLWLMRELCDSVQISADEHGSVVRLRMRRPAVPSPQPGTGPAPGQG